MDVEERRSRADLKMKDAEAKSGIADARKESAERKLREDEAQAKDARIKINEANSKFGAIGTSILNELLGTTWRNNTGLFGKCARSEACGPIMLNVRYSKNIWTMSASTKKRKLIDRDERRGQGL
jgi:hypothetical protein